MDKIKNLDDLKYRKLYIRTEIFKKEQKIKQQFVSLKKEINTAGVKNEILRSALDNPTLIINVARITYKLVKGWKKRRYRKKNKN